MNQVDAIFSVTPTQPIISLPPTTFIVLWLLLITFDNSWLLLTTLYDVWHPIFWLLWICMTTSDYFFILTELAPLGQFSHRVAMSVCLSVCVFAPSGAVFAMAQIRRIGHNHQTPFWHLVGVLLLLDISNGDAKQKQAALCTIHLGPQIFLQILNPL